MKKNIATTALVATAAAGTAVLVAAPASADVERRGTCAGATFELSVDRERGGFEVDADLDGARPGSSWRVAIRHDGKVVTSKVRTADREGEIDVDAFASGSPGDATYAVTFTPADGEPCTATLGS